jgi:hypothetical protein
MHVVKTYGKVEAYLPTFLTSALCRVSDQLRKDKSPSYPVNGRMSEPKGPLGTLWK